MNENLAQKGTRFSNKVRYLDTKLIARLHNEAISVICEERGYTYIESIKKNNLQIMYCDAIFKTSYAGALTYKVSRSG